jgi:poly(3-hydroxybutyrate) depolymerase
MIYNINEMNHKVMPPVRGLAKLNSAILRNPFNPISHIPQIKIISANLEVFSDLTKRYPKPEFGIKSVICNKEVVLVNEIIVKRNDFGQLLNFKKESTKVGEPKLLIIAPMSGHFSTLLRGTVEAMLPDHDVYITDWHDARLISKSIGGFSLDDYIDYIIDFIEEVGVGTHVMAVCQPVVPALAAVTVMSEDDNKYAPASLTLMSGPIDGRIDPTVPCKLATKHDMSWFRKNAIHKVPFPNKGAGRRVYPGFLQLAGFISMNKMNHFNAYKKFHKSLRNGDANKIAKHRDFYNEYLAVMDLPETYYLDTINKVFKEFHLAKGCFEYRGRLLNPSEIKKTSLMTVEGENDDISSPGQTYAAQSLCSSLPASKRNHYVQSGVGHYGVFNGSKWRDEISPKVKDFIELNS